MRNHYDGLEIIRIPLVRTELVAASSCQAMVQLKMENGVCVSDPSVQQIEYVGENG